MFLFLPGMHQQWPWFGKQLSHPDLSEPILGAISQEMLLQLSATIQRTIIGSYADLVAEKSLRATE